MAFLWAIVLRIPGAVARVLVLDFVCLEHHDLQAMQGTTGSMKQNRPNISKHLGTLGSIDCCRAFL